MPLAIPVSELSYFQICVAVQWLGEPDRGPFLQALVDELEGREIGDGMVARAARRRHRTAGAQVAAQGRRWTRTLMPYWACAQLETRRERTALHFLGLNGFTTYCPRIRTEQSSRDRERSTWLFPGYAFVWIELQWHAARWSPGVIRLVSGGSAEPAKVPVSVIENLQSRERNGFVVLPQPPGLTRGDKVQMTHGPLKGSIAIYQGMRGRQRVEVLLTFFGAQQRIVLNRKDVRGI